MGSENMMRSILCFALLAAAYAAPVPDMKVLNIIGESNVSVIELHTITGNHCSDITVNMTMDGPLDQVKVWWSSNSYKYTSYDMGLCSSPFTKVGHIEHPTGISGVTFRDVGQGEFLAAMAEPILDCSFNDTSTDTIALVREATASGNIKIRTCRTGIGCTGDKGEWNS